MTKQELIALFSNGHLVTGGDFESLINSLKGVQSPVSDPTASGTSVTFIATVTQNAEGAITVRKKTVDFSGYQTVANMTGYQPKDLQQIGIVSAPAGESEVITHNMGHFPTVRLIDISGVEVKAALYTVTHINDMSLKLGLDDGAIGSYKYILD